jgi:hypothetical protein
VCLPSNALAQSAPQNTNIAGPSASATGNVTNQAVQVLQGPYSTNAYGSGVVCQGPTLSVQTFAMGNNNYNWDPDSYITGSRNMGVTLGVNVPLDGSGIELCKERARTEIARQQAEADKARLDFELVRLLKCGEAMRMGVRFHPDSPYAGICADIMVIQPPAAPQPEPKSTPKTYEKSNQIRSGLGQENGQEVSRSFQFN